MFFPMDSNTHPYQHEAVSQPLVAAIHLLNKWLSNDLHYRQHRLRHSMKSLVDATMGSKIDANVDFVWFPNVAIEWYHHIWLVVYEIEQMIEINWISHNEIYNRDTTIDYIYPRWYDAFVTLSAIQWLFTSSCNSVPVIDCWPEPVPYFTSCECKRTL